jgi:hypothetical protein
MDEFIAQVEAKAPSNASMYSEEIEDIAQKIYTGGSQVTRR